MTPEQLEAAARKLCEIRGKNPDEETQFGYFDWDTKRVTPTTWLKACENEIRAHLEIQEAVQSLPCECQGGAITLYGTCANCKGSGMQFKP
jgi:RecJ-like exonuclease